MARRPKTFAPLRPAAAGAALATLSPDDASTWRRAVAARVDAQRQAELVLMRARLAVGEAAEAEIAMVRQLGVTYGFDPDQPLQLTADGRVVVAPTNQ